MTDSGLNCTTAADRPTGGAVQHRFRSLRRARLCFWLAVVFTVFFLASFGLTFNRRAWGIWPPPPQPASNAPPPTLSQRLGAPFRTAWQFTTRGPDPDALWPRFACVHRGRVLLFSSLWRRAPGFAWLTPGWMYDAIGVEDRRWLPSYARIGNAYGGTRPKFYSARLNALSIPLWNFAPITGAGAAYFWRRSRTLSRRLANACPACGYSLAGLNTAAEDSRANPRLCPECGSPATSAVRPALSPPGLSR